MKSLVFILLLITSQAVLAQSKEEKKILNVLEHQRQAWNRGDIEGFMKGYFQSDSLMFIGKNGIQWGWQRTLDNYNKSYPDATAMGTLIFDIIKVRKLSGRFYYVVGKWMLNRTIGDVSGHFDLLFEKVGGQWVIIADHSS